MFMTTSLFRSTASQHRYTPIYLDNHKLDPRRNRVEIDDDRSVAYYEIAYKSNASKTTTDKNRGILLLYA